MKYIKLYPAREYMAGLSKFVFLSIPKRHSAIGKSISIAERQTWVFKLFKNTKNIFKFNLFLLDNITIILFILANKYFFCSEKTHLRKHFICMYYLCPTSVQHKLQTELFKFEKDKIIDFEMLKTFFEIVIKKKIKTVAQPIFFLFIITALVVLASVKQFLLFFILKFCHLYLSSMIHIDYRVFLLINKITSGRMENL
ncbi:hypothetical protein AGLY_003708 [Aphis glycines]|uniref:Uncharacterized protein n=1 Tax=Aphis glycines TaxID=307491 RepID=A0A6G0U0C6_APHGL|nr:hypothetical protein AGLY_003708 [Aphis glycines]